MYVALRIFFEVNKQFIGTLSSVIQVDIQVLIVDEHAQAVFIAVQFPGKIIQVFYGEIHIFHGTYKVIFRFSLTNLMSPVTALILLFIIAGI